MTDINNFKRSASGAIINKDEKGLAIAQAKKLARKQQKQKIDELENRISKLETLVQDIVLRHTDDGK
jgi:hypothetical protein